MFCPNIEILHELNENQPSLHESHMQEDEEHYEILYLNYPHPES